MVECNAAYGVRSLAMVLLIGGLIMGVISHVKKYSGPGDKGTDEILSIVFLVLAPLALLIAIVECIIATDDSRNSEKTTVRALLGVIGVLSIISAVLLLCSYFAWKFSSGGVVVIIVAVVLTFLAGIAYLITVCLVPSTKEKQAPQNPQGGLYPGQAPVNVVYPMPPPPPPPPAYGYGYGYGGGPGYGGGFGGGFGGGGSNVNWGL